MKEKLYSALPLICLVTGLLLTVIFFWLQVQRHNLNQHNYYTGQAGNIRQNIQYRLQTYVDEQVAGAAFITASEKVTRFEWRDFVTALKLDVNYPGINGLGFAVPVLKKDSLAFVKAAAQDNAPGFKINGLGQMPNAKDFFAIKFIEPHIRNYQALGFDMGSEPARRAAMEKARDAAKPIISDRVQLVQDHERTPGFLIYVPVFKAVNAADTLSSAFLGWSFAPFIAKNFMDGLLRNVSTLPSHRFELELYDGAKTDTSKMLFKTWVLKPEQTDDTYLTTFPVYGNTWTLRLLPVADFETSKDLKLAYAILSGGVLLSLLLFFLLRALAHTRRNALVLAGKMTRELRTLNQNLDRKVTERTLELAAKNKQLSQNAEALKNAYEDLEVKVKFRNLQLAKQVKALQEENLKLKNQNG